MINFDAADSSDLSKYLNRTKFKLVELLKSKIPKSTAKSFEEVALQAKEAKGWTDCIEEILNLSEKQHQRARPEEFVNVTVGIPK